MIVAAGGGLVHSAAKAATSTIPIVLVIGSDPVKRGLIASLGRPGGNITGIALFTAALGLKRFELLRDLVPTSSKFAVLINPRGALARSSPKRKRTRRGSCPREYNRNPLCEQRA